MQAFPFADLGKLSLKELSDLLNALLLTGEARSILLFVAPQPLGISFDILTLFIALSRSDPIPCAHMNIVFSFRDEANFGGRTMPSTSLEAQNRCSIDSFLVIFPSIDCF